MASITGKLLLSIVGAVAEFETGIRKERKLGGIAVAKAKGTYRGRKPSIDREKKSADYRAIGGEWQLLRTSVGGLPCR